jgi:D-alanyl-D-alanine carboxypeptidase/D-alanyl-D-alanine-endopeptidase (penicillin-binding protein 4)
MSRRGRRAHQACLPPPSGPGFSRVLRQALTLLTLLTLPGAAPAATPTSWSDPSLPAAVHRFLQQPAFHHATWGLLVLDHASGCVLVETNAHRLLKPASNAKLFTGALCLDLLGPSTRLATELIPSGPISPRGTLRGSLIVRGLGDFSLSHRFNRHSPTGSLDSIIQTLHTAGLRRIQGDLVADDAYFTGPAYGTGWTQDDHRYAYGAEVSALALDDNTLAAVIHPGPHPGTTASVSIPSGSSYLRFDATQVSTVPAGGPRHITADLPPGSRLVRLSGSLPAGSDAWTETIPVPNPALFFVHRLREALAMAGIRVAGTARHQPGAASRVNTPDRAPALTLRSPPVSDLVTEMMKPSQNLYAQMLLLQSGARNPNPPAREFTTEDAGIAALIRFAEAAGIPGSEVRLDDGSGLSRSALVTPAAIVQLLRHMDRHPAREVFRGSLPVAGRDGTLRLRFRNTPVEGNLRAKTGSLRHVTALSGFLTTASGRELVFAALLNAYDPEPDAPSGRAAMDSLVTLLAESPTGESP